VLPPCAPLPLATRVAGGAAAAPRGEHSGGGRSSSTAGSGRLEPLVTALLVGFGERAAVAEGEGEAVEEGVARGDAEAAADCEGAPLPLAPPLARAEAES
jgi:hypothetical protein